MTPREYSELRDVWLDELERGRLRQAELLCAIANGPMMRKDGKMWTAEMLLKPDHGTDIRQTLMDRVTTARVNLNSRTIMVPDLFTQIESNRLKAQKVD